MSTCNHNLKLEKRKEFVSPRERICLNGIWSFQEAKKGKEESPPSANWYYIKVPERLGSGEFDVLDKKGNVVVFYPKDPFDARICEDIARSVTVTFGMIAAFGTWVVNGAKLRASLVLNSVTKCEEVGKAINEGLEWNLLKKKVLTLKASSITVSIFTVLI